MCIAVYQYCTCACIPHNQIKNCATALLSSVQLVQLCTTLSCNDRIAYSISTANQIELTGALRHPDTRRHVPLMLLPQAMKGYCRLVSDSMVHEGLASTFGMAHSMEEGTLHSMECHVPWQKVNGFMGTDDEG